MTARSYFDDRGVIRPHQPEEILDAHDHIPITMLIRRLTWCGVELEAADGSTAVIDLLEDATSLAPFLGAPDGPLFDLPYEGRARVAAVTHLHRDHADAGAVARALRPGGVLLRPPAMRGELLEIAGTRAAEQELDAHSLPTLVLDEGQTSRQGPFQFTALRAVDGSGDTQVTWLVEVDGGKVVHAGDTMWHGEWWRRAIAHGPIDVAFLPINGAIGDFPHRQPSSGLAGAMTPEQAVAAAAAMQARHLVPIHYGLFDSPPHYSAIADAEARLLSAAERLNITVELPPLGQQLKITTPTENTETEKSPA
jgi:L-ascorbate metabolism protein UlaG (beta-lactamase superfamily)